MIGDADTQSEGLLRRAAFQQRTAIGIILALAFFMYLNLRAGGPGPFDIIKTLVKFVILWWHRIDSGGWWFLFDLFLLLAAFYLWLAYFSQFVLPVRSLRQRWQSLKRLARFIRGAHGPVTVIQDGRPAVGRTDKASRSPGIALLDSASAAVLRTSVRFKDAIGPGLTFTGKGERIAGVVDLHEQTAPLPTGFGPLSDEDPFAPQGKTETEANFQARQKRRMETSAMTRDGIEVAANILVVFGLDPGEERDPASENGRQFAFYPQAVQSVVAAEAIDPEASEFDPRRHILWNDLPPLLAVDLWREYLRKFTLNQLFAPLEAKWLPHGGNGGSEPPTAYQRIQAMVLQRLTQPFVEDLDSEGCPTGGWQESNEFKALQSRRIRVKNLIIRNLKFPPAVEEQLVRLWFAQWEHRAKDERDSIERRRSYAVHQGQRDAQQDFARWAVRFLNSRFLEVTTPANEGARREQLRSTVAQLLQGTRTQCVSDTRLHQRLTVEERSLDAIIDWVQKQQGI